MPVILCPKCKGKLRLPDDTGPRRVKCPNCSFVFMSNQAAVDGGAPSKAPPARPKSASGAAQAAMKKREEPDEDFDVVDEDDRPRAKRRVPDDEDEDDRPRAKRRRVDDDDDDEDDRPRRRRRDDDDDDEDDRPRAKRRRDDDDDDEDDRPRARRRRVDDDDDDDDRPRRRRRDEGDDDADDYPKSTKRRQKEEQSRAETGVFLNFIACWIAAGGVGVAGLGALVACFGSLDLLPTAALIGGIAGLGATITGMVGYGFMVAGPKANGAMGLSIATLSVAGVRLLVLILIVSNVIGGVRGAHGAEMGGGGIGGGFLLFFNSFLPFTFLLGMGVGAGGSVAIPFMPVGLTMGILALILEFVQFLLFTFYLKAITEGVKDRRAAGSSKLMAIVSSSGLGGLLLLGVLVSLILRASASDTGRGGAGGLPSTGGQLVAILVVLVCWGGVSAMYSFGAVICGMVRAAVQRRR